MNEKQRKEAKFPIAYNQDGRPVPPEKAIPCVRHGCPTCDTAKLIVVTRADGKKHFRSMPGTIHSGRVCVQVEDGKGRIKLKVVDKNRVLSNAIRRRAQKPPEVDDFKHPQSPSKEPNEVVICSSLDEIRKKRLGEMDNFQICEGEWLTDHFVSEKNAYLVLSNNNSLNVRMLEVEFDYILPWTQSIRFALRARKWQNGRQTAAWMVLDFVCESNEEFCTARNRFFISYRDLNGKLRFLPRYKKALIVGDFHAVPKEHCRDNMACSKLCMMAHIHCVGRQKATLLKALGQINVDEADKIDYSYLNGWIKNYE